MFTFIGASYSIVTGEVIPSLIIYHMAHDVQDFKAVHDHYWRGLPSLIHQVVRQRDYARVPTLCCRVHQLVSTLAGGLVVIETAWSICKSLFMQSQVDVEQKKKELVECKAAGERIKQKIKDDVAIETIKLEISEWCTQWFAVIADGGNWGEMFELSGSVIEFQRVTDKMKKVLERVAEKVEPSEEESLIDNTPLMGLSSLHLTMRDINEISETTCGTKEDNGTSLSFKMAEKQIFSKRDLQTLFQAKQCHTKEEMKKALIAHLGRHDKGVLDTLPENIKATALQVDRVMASVIASSALAMGLLGGYRAFQMWRKEKVLYPLATAVVLPLIDTLFFIWRGDPDPIAVADFASGTWKERCVWICTTADVFGHLIAVVVKTWRAKEGHMEVFGNLLYKTFVSG